MIIKFNFNYSNFSTESLKIEPLIDELGNPFSIVLNQTALWYKKRQKFVLGPDLPNYFSPMTLQLYKNICSVSLNSTHVMLFGFLVDEGYTIHQYKGVAIIEFSRNIWTNLAPLPIEYHESIKKCHAAPVFDKLGNQKIWLIAHKYNRFEYASSWLELMSYELSHGSHWNIEASYQIGEKDMYLGKYSKNTTI